MSSQHSPQRFAENRPNENAASPVAATPTPRPQTNSLTNFFPRASSSTPQIPRAALTDSSNLASPARREDFEVASAVSSSSKKPRKERSDKGQKRKRKQIQEDDENEADDDHNLDIDIHRQSKKRHLRHINQDDTGETEANPKASNLAEIESDELANHAQFTTHDGSSGSDDEEARRNVRQIEEDMEMRAAHRVARRYEEEMDEEENYGLPPSQASARKENTNKKIKKRKRVEESDDDEEDTNSQVSHSQEREETRARKRLQKASDKVRNQEAERQKAKDARDRIVIDNIRKHRQNIMMPNLSSKKNNDGLYDDDDDSDEERKSDATQQRKPRKSRREGDEDEDDEDEDEDDDGDADDYDQIVLQTDETLEPLNTLHAGENITDRSSLKFEDTFGLRVWEVCAKAFAPRESVIPSPEALLQLMNDCKQDWYMLDSQRDVDQTEKVDKEFYGGGFSVGEVNIEQRITEWHQHYKATIHRMWLLVNMSIGDGSEDQNVKLLTTKFFKSMERRIDNTRDLKLSLLEIFRDRNNLSSKGSADNPLGDEDDFQYIPFVTSFAQLANLKESQSHIKFLIYCEEEAESQHLQRLGEDFWEPIRTADGSMKHSVKKKCTVKDFVYECGSKKKNWDQFLNRTTKPGTTSWVERELKENKNGIRDLKRDRTCWSFGDVFYDPVGKHKFGDPNTLRERDAQGNLLHADRKYRYGIDKLPNKTAARDFEYPLRDHDPVGPDFYGPDADGNAMDEDMKPIPRLPKGKVVPDAEWLQENNLAQSPDYYILWDDALNDGDGGWRRNIKSVMDIQTPSFEKLLNTQKLERAVKKIIYVLCGRLAFWIGLKNGGDNWALTPLFYGVAGTGKSTILQMVCQMYHSEDIFDMESQGEEVFILWRAVDPVQKWIWRNLEVKPGLRLSPDRYQRMTDGARMSIPTKGGAPWEGDFIAPGAQAGNDRLPLKDTQGSISRRTPTIEHPVEVHDVDTTLMQTAAPEMPDLIRKMVMIYLFFREWVGKRKAMDCFPNYFKQTTLNLQKSSNAAIAFHQDQKFWIVNKQPIIEGGSEYYEIEFNNYMNAFREKTDSKMSEDSVKSALQGASIGLSVIDYDMEYELRTKPKQLCDIERVPGMSFRQSLAAQISTKDDTNRRRGVWIRGLMPNPNHSNQTNSNQYGGNDYHSSGNHGRSTQYNKETNRDLHGSEVANSTIVVAGQDTFNNPDELSDFITAGF